MINLLSSDLTRASYLILGESGLQVIGIKKSEGPEREQ
jgi:hypothetical protein